MGQPDWNGNHHRKAALVKETMLRSPSWNSYFREATMLLLLWLSW